MGVGLTTYEGNDTPSGASIDYADDKLTAGGPIQTPEGLDSGRSTGSTDAVNEEPTPGITKGSAVIDSPIA